MGVRVAEESESGPSRSEVHPEVVEPPPPKERECRRNLPGSRSAGGPPGGVRPFPRGDRARRDPIGDRGPAPGAQEAERRPVDPTFLGSEVADGVGADPIDGGAGDRERFDLSAAERRVPVPARRGVLPGLREPRGRHVDPEDRTWIPRLLRRQEAVGARSAFRAPGGRGRWRSRMAVGLPPPRPRITPSGRSARGPAVGANGPDTVASSPPDAPEPSSPPEATEGTTARGPLEAVTPYRSRTRLLRRSTDTSLHGPPFMGCGPPSFRRVDSTSTSPRAGPR